MRELAGSHALRLAEPDGYGLGILENIERTAKTFGRKAVLDYFESWLIFRDHSDLKWPLTAFLEALSCVSLKWEPLPGTREAWIRETSHLKRLGCQSCGCEVIEWPCDRVQPYCTSCFAKIGNPPPEENAA
jgi:hypothetical protein